MKSSKQATSRADSHPQQTPAARPQPKVKRAAPPRTVTPARGQSVAASPLPSRTQSVSKVLQRKAASSGQTRTTAASKRTPTAPPVYRPQPAPKVLQRKKKAGQQPPSGQPRQTPAPPKVYRPQPAPHCLQLKAASKQPPSPSQNRRTPVAPPVYRPQPLPKVLQAKKASAAPTRENQGVRTPTAPPVYRPQPLQKCLQAKLVNGRPAPSSQPNDARARKQSTPKPSTPTRPLPNRTRPLIQAKFTLKGKELNASHISEWYASHLQTMGEAVPATERDVLQILINTRGETFTIEDFDTESDPPAALVKFLKTREKEMRPGVKIYDDSGESTWTRYHGPLSVSSPGTLTNWNLGAHQQLAATARGQGYTELAHVAFKSSYFASKEVDTGYGKNPGEFGTAFYLTTGHEVEAQQEVSKVWKPADKDAPDDIVKFRIPNTLLSKLVGDDVGLRDFLIHILQHSHGYPLGMNEDAAVALMDRINAQGKVLIFPDDKDKKVVIKTGDAKKSWREYTEANAGPSGHYVIIGPQRPGALDNIRQIAFRGGMGQYLINSVARSLETISGAAPK